MSWTLRLLVTVLCLWFFYFMVTSPSDGPRPWWGIPFLALVIAAILYYFWWPLVVLTTTTLKVRTFAKPRSVELAAIQALTLGRGGLRITLSDRTTVIAVPLQKGLGSSLFSITTRADHARATILDAVQRARAEAGLDPASVALYGNKHNRPRRRG